MKQIQLLFILMATIFFSSCKDDTFSDGGSYSEGEPASLSMKITVPVDKKVTPLSRSLNEDLESAITQLIIKGWEINSGRELFIDLTDKLTSTSITTSAGRTYNLSEDITGIKSGRYRLYLIANWQSAYANLTAAKIEAMSEDQIKELVFNNTGKRITLYGDYGLPMTQKLTQTGVDYYQINPGNDNKLENVMLERVTAHIEFSITNAEGDVANNNVPNFVPASYTLYRLPAGAKSYADAEPIQTTYFNSSTEPIVLQPDEGGADAYTFDFFMLENKQTSTATGMTNWYDREAWDGATGNDYASRKFTNAPENATFIVITGDYSGPAVKNESGYSNEQFFGPVSYIIHLGNFNTTQGGSLTNFSVNRNEHHIYNITVTGASTILANVTVENQADVNASVEGYLSTQPIAAVDAHYEKVMLEIPKSSVYPANNGQNINRVVLSTPRNGFSQTEIAVSSLTDNDDYKWIQFQAPESRNIFPKYAGENNHGDNGFAYITDLVKEFEEYLAGNTSALKHATVEGDLFLVAAFIDENIYDATDDPAMLRWANSRTNNRIMQLNPQDRRVSPDGQSTRAATSAFNIQQKQVMSTYSLDPSVAAAAGITVYNPFGFEQVEEATNIANATDNELTQDASRAPAATRRGYFTNALTKGFWTSAMIWDAANSTNPSDIPNGNGRTLTLDWFTQFSTGNGVADETTSFYKLTSVEGKNYSSYIFTPAADFYTVSKAIVARNRDLNGDGYISADEIRWYVPNVVQYYIYNFGYDRIPEDLRLPKFAEDNIDIEGTYSSYKGDRDYMFPRYFNSSRNKRRLFWQDQRGTTSELLWWASQANNVRFVRNLGQFATANTDDFTRMAQRNATNRTIRIVNNNICRSQSWTTAYPAAYALDNVYNRLPHMMEYCSADSALTLFTNDNTVPNSFIATDTRTLQEALDNLNANVLTAYNTRHGSNWTALPNGWRIPNQRELIALFVTGVINDYYTDAVLAGCLVFSCTSIDSKLWYDRKTFIALNGGFLGWGASYDGRANGYVILVRDIDETTGLPIADQNTPATASNDGRFSGGSGSAIR